MKKLACLILGLLLIISMISVVNAQDGNGLIDTSEREEAPESDEPAKETAKTTVEDSFPIPQPPKEAEAPEKKGFLGNIIDKIKNFFASLFGVEAPAEDQQIVPAEETVERREISIVAIINQNLQQAIDPILKIDTKMDKPDSTQIANVADKISRLPENQREGVVNNIKYNIQNYKNPFNNPDALTEILNDISNELDTALPTGVIPSEGFISGKSPGLTTGDAEVVQDMVERGAINVMKEGAIAPLIFTVVYEDGNPAPGEGVTLESIPPIVTFDPKSGTTNADGEFETSVTFPEGVSIEKIVISGKVTTNDEASVPSAGIIIVSDVFLEEIQDIVDDLRTEVKI